jgi:hypothetical protein
MERVSGFFSKTPEITKSLATLIDNENFKDNLEKAGSIGALINLGIGLYEHLKNDFKTKNELAFASLIKIASESAQESLADSNEIEIKNAKSKETKKQLFDTFIKTEGWNSYLPDHPVIVQFRSFICDMLRYEQQNKVLKDFVFNFNIALEEKAENDPDLAPFKKMITQIEHNKNLTENLEKSRSIIYKSNGIDQRSLYEYYIENNAVEQRIKKISHGLPELKVNNMIDNLLKSPQNRSWLIVIAAPFGIGKTSLCMHLTYSYASKFLEDPNFEYNYIPIFIPLKYTLNNIDDEGNSLDYVIRLIAPGDEGKKRKILLICDGLDEYDDDIAKLIELLQRKRENELPNMKVLITSRLKAELLRKLGIRSYIELLPFNKHQVNEFFEKYGIPSLNYDTLVKDRLKTDMICKPLFCWMFATMSQSENEVISKNQYNNVSVKKSLIYQRIIHKITRGKHKDIVNEEYNWKQQHYSAEKQILRKIAAITQAHNYDNLTKDMIIQELENYQIHFDEETLQKGLEPILDCYLHEMNDADKNISVEFIDTSFRDYLVSEYYIESIFEGKPYYLSQGIPTKEVLEFLDGLLELFNTQEKDKDLEIFLKSLHSYNEKIRELSNLYNENIRELSIQDVKAKLLENSRSFFRDEEIIHRAYAQSNYRDKIWYVSKFPYIRYGELSIHRWLSLYTLIRLDPQTEFDTKSLERLIKSTSHNIPPHLKKLRKINLS